MLQSGRAAGSFARVSVAASLVALSCGAPDAPASASHARPAPPTPASASPAPPTFTLDPAPAPPAITTAAPRLDFGAPCDPTRTVPAGGENLLVRDPEVLARFSLERLVGQILRVDPGTTPTDLLQRLFDTQRSATTGAFPDADHCTEGADCPRAEGALATRTGFFTDGDPDHFSPVAVVARFDLMPSDLRTCGEYRVVYAKDSGKTDPSNRLFLIFEGVLPGSGDLRSCRPVAELWSGIGSLDPVSRADALDAFFFDGTGGLGPVVAAANYGLDRGACAYGGSCGQVRVGFGMQEPWELRQYRVGGIVTPDSKTHLWLLPMPTTGSPRPALFDPTTGDPAGARFRDELLGHLGDLATPELARARLPASFDFDADRSVAGAPADASFRARVPAGTTEGASFALRLAAGLASLDGTACPPGDPLSPDGLLDRATAASCAGCHAPDLLLPPGRRVGCGQAWPASLGRTHVDENGAVSPALRDVFLPHRAQVLQTYLQACDSTAVLANLQPVPPIPPIIECFIAGTPVTMADGSRRAIEDVRPGDRVLSVDEPHRALVPARVDQVFVRPSTDRLVTVNRTLVATPNHLFRTTRGWIAADSLTPGDHLLEARTPEVARETFELAMNTVDSLTVEPRSVVTYNLGVRGTHAYFAGGVLVHDGP